MFSLEQDSRQRQASTRSFAANFLEVRVWEQLLGVARVVLNVNGRLIV
jgi:hypothetical protein